MDDEDEDDEDDEDDENNPLAKGVDSVSWLPTVVGAKDVDNPQITRENAQFLPLFPLGGIVYTPNSEHVLNIFEPRYRQMYSDILMNGTKRFVVSMSHPTLPGSFAKMGVLFELQELKEVSEQTDDAIKYICNHKVTGRVELHRILNPSAWEKRDTYLRVEGVVFDDSEIAKTEDSGNDVYGAVSAAAMQSDVNELEKSLKNAFSVLVDVQHQLAEDVRFTRESVATLAVQDGPGPKGLWSLIKLWQTFADQRLMSRQQELQQKFQERLQAFLREKRGLKSTDEMPSAIGFNELSKELQDEVKELQKRMATELKPLLLESTLTMQKILEAKDHKARLKLMRCFIEAETRRLNTKKALQGMFSETSSLSGGSTTTTTSTLNQIPPEERLDDPVQPTEPPSLLGDDDDEAWQ